MLWPSTSSYTSSRRKATRLDCNLDLLLLDDLAVQLNGMKIQHYIGRMHMLGAENCIVIAEGELDHRGIFKAVALGMPPVESQEDSMAAIKVCTHVQ